MKMKQLPLDDATDEQIADFLEVQGVDVAREDRGGLLALLSIAWQHPYILVADAPEASEGQRAQTIVEPQTRMQGGVGQNDPRVTVTIGTTMLPGGKHPASVSVNGHALVIQRAMKVEIPYRYYLALLEAKNSDISQDDPSKPPVEVEVSNYPLTVHSLPSQSEIDAWHARVDGELMPA